MTGRRGRYARGPFETLESRVLLSTGTDPTTGMATGISIPLTSFYLVEAGSIGQWMSPAPDATGSTLIVPVSTSAGAVPSAGGGGVVAALLTSSQAGGSLATAGMLSVMSTASGSLGEDADTPVIVVPTSILRVQDTPLPGAASVSMAGPNPGGWPGIHDWNPFLPHDGIGASKAGTTSSDASGAGSPGSNIGTSPPPASAPPPPTPLSSSPSGPQGPPPMAPWSTSWAGMPDSPHVEMEAALDPSHDSWMVQIPVGPMTHELGLTIHGDPSLGPERLPVLGPMALYDHSGDILARLNPVDDGPSGGSTDAVTLSLQDVPTGGVLLVQVSAPTGLTSSASPVPAGGTTSTSSGWSTPFVMDVQRIESAVSASTAGQGAGTGAAAVGGLVIGTLVTTAEPNDPGWSSVRSSGSGVVAMDPSAGLDPGGVVQSVDESTGLEWSSDEPQARIAVGPLASRAAAPIGPSLSSVAVDPAPPIDRHERAMAEEVTAIEPGPDAPSLAYSATTRGLDPAEDGSDDSDRGYPDAPERAAVSIVGLGPLRLRASTTRVIERRRELGTLADAFCSPGRSDDERGALLVDGSEADPVLVALAAPVSTDADRRPTPDYLTSACFLALGLGLVTRPIIPDLLRLFPTRSSRWGPNRGGGSGCLADSIGCRKSFGSWLRRRLDPKARPLPLA